jgi:Flp pilus assembly protein TadB
MRHLLGGVAIAALLAAGLPAAAQNAGTDQQQAPATTHHSMHKAKHSSQHAQAKAKKGARASSNDNMAEELNRQELERVSQGTSQMPASGTTMPGH